MLSTVDGNPFNYIDLENGALGITSATSATDCCTQCATTAGCAGFVLLGGSCYIAADSNYGETCNAAASSWTFTTSQDGSEVTIRNGNCGQGTLEGSA